MYSNYCSIIRGTTFSLMMASVSFYSKTDLCTCCACTAAGRKLACSILQQFFPELEKKWGLKKYWRKTCSSFLWGGDW